MKAPVSLWSVCHGDIYRHESGRGGTFNLFLSFHICMFSFYISSLKWMIVIYKWLKFTNICNWNVYTLVDKHESNFLWSDNNLLIQLLYTFHLYWNVLDFNILSYINWLWLSEIEGFSWCSDCFVAYITI